MTVCPICARDVVVENGLVTCPSGCVHRDLDQACESCAALRAINVALAPEIERLTTEHAHDMALIAEGHAVLKSMIDAFAAIGIVAPNGRTAAEDIAALGAERDQLRAANVALVAAREQLYTERTKLVGELRAAIALINDKEWRKPEAQIELRRLREVAGL